MHLDCDCTGAATIALGTRPNGLSHAFRCLLPLTAWAILLLGGCLPIPESITEDIVIDTDNVDELLDRYTHSHLDYGCSMVMMTESEQSYVGFRDVIENASSTIDMETLNFDNDQPFPQDIALEFAQLLADKAHAGVRVRVMLDSLTSNVLGRPEVNQVLADGGGDVREYRPDRSLPESLFYRMHKKILIADGQRAVIGGSNYGYRYEGPQQWRDTNVLLTGPIVATLQQEFDYDWDNRSGPHHLVTAAAALPEPSGPFALREIDQKPSENDFDINHAIIIGLRLARQRVDIEAPYFNPTDWLIAELADAVARGVQVRILMNSQMSIDVPQGYYAEASLFGTVLERGIRVFLWDRAARTMHSKAMVVDDSLAMVGTYNFNARSILWDTENVIFTTDPGAIQLIDEMIQNDFQQQDVIREIDLDWVNSQPPGEQFKWDLYGLFAPLF